MDNTTKIPVIGHLGKMTSEKYGYFRVPEGMGKILTAESTYEPNEVRKNNKQKLLIYVGLLSCSILLSLFLLLTKDFDGFLGKALAVIIPNGISIFAASALTYYGGTNSFVCEEGFALYRFKGQLDNLVEDIEINFHSVTNVRVEITHVKENFVYKETKFRFRWYYNNEVLHEIKGRHTNHDDTSADYSFDYYFMMKAENQWQEFRLKKNSK